MVAVLAVAGCADDDEEATPPQPTTTAPTTTEPGTTTEPLDDFVPGPVAGPPQGAEIALNDRVALGQHEGYDRIVFQFRNVVPGYRVEYVQPPIQEDGSGATVKIDGHSFAQVRMELASGFDVTVPEGKIVYTGPRRISGSGIVAELVRTGDFEAVLTWAVGLHAQVPMRVFTLEGPPRLVVDFRSS